MHLPMPVKSGVVRELRKASTDVTPSKGTEPRRLRLVAGTDMGGVWFGLGLGLRQRW